MQHDFILLDRSSSMSGLWDEALGSINGYVKKLADEKVDTGVTLAAFDGQAGLKFDVLRDRITPSTWRDVSDKDTTPRGMTPLNDAVGRIVALADAGNYDKVALIIMTDGAENDSKELTVTQAKALLAKCRAKGWQVIFLGANYDNATQAKSYANLDSATISASVGNLRATMTATASKRAAYGITGQSVNFSDDEKAAAKK